MKADKNPKSDFSPSIRILVKENILSPVMNNTKWNELAKAMHAQVHSPVWKTLSIGGYYSQGDRDWFYHFKDGGYKDIMYVDIETKDDNQKENIRSVLKKFTFQASKRCRVFAFLAISIMVTM